MKLVYVRSGVFLVCLCFLSELSFAGTASAFKKRLLLRRPSSLSGSSADLSSVTSGSSSLPTSLKDAYLAAIEQASGPQAENIKIQREIFNQTGEIERQATGALFPTITGAATFLTQPPPGTAVGSSISPSNQNTVKITADQPLFRGLREYATLRQKKYLVDAQVHLLLNAARQLFYDVATAYYNVAAYSQDEDNYRLEILGSKSRLEELQGFYKIGRSQLTDVLTFESNIASLEAQLAATHGQLEIARDTLAIFTGWDRNVVLNDKDSVPLNLGNISTYLEKVEQRPDVQLAIDNVKANEEGVPVAWGAHLPNIDLLADYYITRPGSLSDVNWDASIALTIPIYQGGIVQSQVRQAQSVVRQYSSLLWQARKTAEQEIRIFYDTVSAETNQLAKLEELVKISKKNYETEVKFYKNGLVTNLDVLTAMTTYTDAQRQFDHLSQTLKLDSVKLQAATGDRPEIKVKPNANP